jgi:hypothetical protein
MFGNTSTGIRMNAVTPSMTITSAPTITVKGLRSEKLGIEPILQINRELPSYAKDAQFPGQIGTFSSKMRGANERKRMFRRSVLRYLRMKVGASTA